MKFLNEHKTGISFLLSIFLLFTFSLATVTAATDTAVIEDVFQVNDVIEYTKPCLNNGTWCSGVATCNYTFYDRDNSIRYNNIPAEFISNGSSSLWRLNITHVDTGLYKVDMLCLDGSLKGSETLYYEVTGDGVNNSLGFYIILIALSFGIIIWGLSMEDPPITILGTFGLYFVALYILFNGIAGTKDAVTTWGIGVILLAIAFYVSTRAAWELIVD